MEELKPVETDWEALLEENHAQLRDVSEGLAYLNAEWVRLQEEQGIIIRGIREANSIEA